MQLDESEVRKSIHDLNNMLATVLGSAELIASDAPTGSQVLEDAQNIRDAALRGRGLVEDLRRHLNLK